MEHTPSKQKKRLLDRDLSETPSPKRSRKELCFDKKIDLIKRSEAFPKPTQRDLAKFYGVGTSTVSDILKKKDDLKKQFADNVSCKRKRFNSGSKFAELNTLVLKWFEQARAKNLPLSGPIIQEKALQFAQQLQLTEFKASNGWLDSFKDRNNIGFFKISGESADVDIDVVDTYKHRLPDIVLGYEPKDIFNCDETGLFFRALPDKTLAKKGESCKGGKLAKERLTVMLACSETGEKLKPLVIGKSENPRCFKNIKKSQLPVKWAFNKKAWMTRDIFKPWVTDINSQMKKEKRNIVMFLDNATSHSHELKLSNVKFQFFPACTTSKLQPLDLGIIRAFKARYRKRLLRHMIVKLDQSEKASEIAKSVNVLECIHWINESWLETESSTIAKCFHQAGFPVGNPTGTEYPDVESDDPDDDIPLAHLLHINVGDFNSACDIEEGLETEETFSGDWEKDLVSDFLQDTNQVGLEDDDDYDDTDIDTDTSNAGADMTYRNVYTHLQMLYSFAVHKDDRFLKHVSELKTLTENIIVDEKSRSTQKTMTDFFQKH